MKKQIERHVYPPMPDAPMVKATMNGDGLPESGGVYFVWREGEIVYVGQSIHLCNRANLTMHNIIQEGDELSWLDIDKFYLNWAECFYIGIVRPWMNFGADARHRKCNMPKSVKGDGDLTKVPDVVGRLPKEIRFLCMANYVQQKNNYNWKWTGVTFKKKYGYWPKKVQLKEAHDFGKVKPSKQFKKMMQDSEDIHRFGFVRERTPSNRKTLHTEQIERYHNQPEARK